MLQLYHTLSNNDMISQLCFSLHHWGQRVWSDAVMWCVMTSACWDQPCCSYTTSCLTMMISQLFFSLHHWGQRVWSDAVMWCVMTSACWDQPCCSYTTSCLTMMISQLFFSLHHWGQRVWSDAVMWCVMTSACWDQPCCSYTTRCLTMIWYPNCVLVCTIGARECDQMQWCGVWWPQPAGTSHAVVIPQAV